MIKKIIGIVVALAAVAVIVFTILHRNAYTSMLFGEEQTEIPPAIVPEPVIEADTLPAQDVTRVEEEVPDTLHASEIR